MLNRPKHRRTETVLTQSDTVIWSNRGLYRLDMYSEYGGELSGYVYSQERNTVDCLKFVRLLNDLGVVVCFEEQGIYTNQPGAEFYITIYGCIAQSESDNISANVKWGKARSAKEGNVPFHYKNFLGYRKGADGKPEIDPNEAETVRFIYERFLADDSLSGIAQKLNDLQVPTPSGRGLCSGKPLIFAFYSDIVRILN